MVRLVTINAALIAAVLLAAELLFGYWLWGDPLDGLNVFRNVTWRFDVSHLYDRDTAVTYRRDAWGLRGDYGTPAEVDILTVGGSTTDERFIDEGETWPDVLAGCLAAKGKPHRVANGGVTGQSTRGTLANFEYWFPRIPGLAPKVLVAYVGTNDIWAASKSYDAMDDPRRLNEQRDVVAETSILFQRAKMKSALYRLYRTATGAWAAWRAGFAYGASGDGNETAAAMMDRRVGEIMAQTTAKSDPVYLETSARIMRLYGGPLDAYRGNLKRLIDVARARGMRLVLATQRWAIYRDAGDRVVGDIESYIKQEAFNDVTRAACAADAGVACIDLARGMTFRPGDNYDVIHTTPAGSRRVGEFICEGLAALSR